MRSNILEHNDGIVHNVTDGNTQTRKRNHVERTARCIQIDERSNQRHRNGDYDNHGCSPSAKEDEHNQCHEQHCVYNSLNQRVNSVVDVLRSINDDTQFYIRRKILLKVRKHLHNLVRDGNRVSTTLLLHHNHGTLNTVVECALRTLLKVILNASHIAKIYVRSVASANNNVQHLLRVCKLALDTNRVCLRTNINSTVCNVSVLGSDGVTNLSRAEVVSLHLLWVHVDVNLTLRSTRD